MNTQMTPDQIEAYVRQHGRQVDRYEDDGGPENGPDPQHVDSYIRLGSLELRSHGDEVLLTATVRRVARNLPEFVDPALVDGAAVVVKNTCKAF